MRPLLVLVPLAASLSFAGCSCVDERATGLGVGERWAVYPDAGGAGDGGAVGEAFLAASPPEADLGGVRAGGLGTETKLTILNTSQKLDTGGMTIAVVGAQAAEFRVVGGTCASGRWLGPGGGCSLFVLLAPTSNGEKAATLEVSATPGGTARVALTGRGMPGARLTITPPLATLGEVPFGTLAAPVLLTVANDVGAAPSGPLRLALGGSGAGELRPGAASCVAGKSLAGGETCTVSFGLACKGPGAKSASFTASAEPGGAATSTLVGSCVQPAELSLAPPSVDLGSARPGEAGSTMSVVVTNAVGAATSGALSVRLAGSNAAELELVGGDCEGSVLAGGAQCTARVRLRPTTLGAKGGELVVGASPGGTVAASLSGSAVAGAAGERGLDVRDELRRRLRLDRRTLERLRRPSEGRR